MRIFLSHSSRNKPLLREIRRHFPDHINSWLDEKSLFIGQSLTSNIKDTIETKSDYVILFVDNYSINSEWVKKELRWSIQIEKELNRTFVLPVVLEKEAWELIEPKEFHDRKYLSCLEYDETSIQLLASNLISELFALLSLDIEKKNSNTKSNHTELGLLDDADNFIKNAAREIRSIVFPYRHNNPIKIEDLMVKMANNSVIKSISVEQFKQLLVRMSNQGYISGVHFNGIYLFIDEEHYSWKTQLHVELKAKVAYKAIELITSGQTIALDAGSTTLELTNLLCQGLLMRIWTGIKIITNSISAANVLLETSSKLGLLDSNNTLNVYVPGGRIRPNTLAIVDALDDDPVNGIQQIFDTVGKADIAFIGTNGISIDRGFTTHCESEVITKKAFITNSKKIVILGNSAKFGLEEELTFINFDENITLMTDIDTNSIIVEKYLKLSKSGNSNINIILAT